MAEIEHFVDPESNKRHERVSPTRQGYLTIRNAVQSGLVDNETLGYFLARVYLFLLKIGVDKTTASSK